MQGPATWRGQGSAEATATLVVDYNTDDAAPVHDAADDPPPTTAPDVPPVAEDDDDVTVDEDGAATPIDVLGNDTDADGGPIAIDRA